jgi:hypothetical protein
MKCFSAHIFRFHIVKIWWCGVVFILGTSLNLYSQPLNTADSTIISAFLKDLEAEGCPTIIRPSRLVKEWYGLSYTADGAGKVTELSIGFDLIFRSIVCSKLPPSIATLNNLHQLKTLRLVNLGLQQLPQELRNLDHLETLDLSFNHLAELPAELADMGALRSISLAHNDLTSFPAPLLIADQLKDINLSFNLIVGTIPAEIWPMGTNTKVKLNFSNNLLSGNVSFPTDATLIDELDITNNRFLLQEVDQLRTKWPRDNFGLVPGLYTHGQSTGTKTLSPAAGTSVELSIENYVPEGPFGGWWKLNPIGMPTKLTENVSYGIPSFDPVTDAGKYEAVIVKSAGNVLRYGPVILRRNPQAPVLNLSHTSIQVRPGRALHSITMSFQDDFTAKEELTVAVASLPANLEITSKMIEAGEYELLISVKDPGWIGQESFTVLVTDEDGLVASQVVKVSIVNQTNASPVVSSIPEVFPYTDSTGTDVNKYYYSLVAVPLHHYGIDDYDSARHWHMTFNADDRKRLNNLGKQIDFTEGYINVTDNDQCNVRPVFSESIRFTVIDRDGGVGTGVLPIRFPAKVNQAPKVTPIADRYHVKGSTEPLIIDLGPYLKDDLNKVEDLRIESVTSVSQYFNVAVKGHLLEFTPHTPSANEADLFTVTVVEPNVYMALTISISVKEQEGTAPLISQIQDQVIMVGNTFTPVVLDEIVYDDNTKPSLVEWKFVGQQHLKTEVANNILRVSPIDPSWRGSEIIKFVATDSDEKSDERAVVFTIEDPFNYPPNVRISPQRAPKDSAFTAIDLLTSVNDDTTLPKDITWVIDMRDAPDLVVAREENIVTITPKNIGWRGRNYVIFEATDQQGKSSNSYVEFSKGFLAPVVKPIPPVVRMAGTFSILVDLNEYITDDVTPLENLGVHLLSEDGNLYPELDFYPPLNLITLSVMPRTGWIGTEKVQLKVIDGDGLETLFEVIFTVINKNYTVSGSIKGPDEKPLADVTLGGLTVQVKTDVNGEYVTTAPANINLTLVPSLSGYSFIPQQYVITNLTSNLVINFTGTSNTLPKKYSVTGKIEDLAGIALPGVTLNGFSNPVITNFQGNYETLETESWEGTITPVKEDYVFTPASKVITKLLDNVTYDFTAEYVSVVTGIDADELGLTLYPNPSDGVFMMDLPLSSVTRSIQIFTATGILVQDHVVLPELTAFQVKLPGKGIYLVKVNVNNKTLMEKIAVH